MSQKKKEKKMFGHMMTLLPFMSYFTFLHINSYIKSKIVTKVEQNCTIYTFSETTELDSDYINEHIMSYKSVMFIVSIWNIKPSTFDNLYVQNLDIKYFILSYTYSKYV